MGFFSEAIYIKATEYKLLRAGCCAVKTAGNKKSAQKHKYASERCVTLINFDCFKQIADTYIVIILQTNKNCNRYFEYCLLFFC